MQKATGDRTALVSTKLTQSLTGDMAKMLFEIHADDSYALGRGQTLHALFLGHLEGHLKDQIPVLEAAMEATVAAG